MVLTRILNPGGSVVKNPPASAEDTSSIPGSGRPPREGTGNPLQYLGNPMDRGAWRLQSMGSQRVGGYNTGDQKDCL